MSKNKLPKPIKAALINVGTDAIKKLLPKLKIWFKKVQEKNRINRREYWRTKIAEHIGRNPSDEFLKITEGIKDRKLKRYIRRYNKWCNRIK
jgi:hypothetical protein